MQPASRLPRLTGLALAGAVIATPALAGLLVAATPGRAAASDPHAVTVVADPVLGPAVGLDRDGIGLGDVTVDPRTVTSGVSDIGITTGTGQSMVEPVDMLRPFVRKGLSTLSTLEATLSAMAPVTLR